MQIFGSTRLTQASAVSLLLSGVCVVVLDISALSLLLSSVCVVVVVFCGSSVCVVFMVSFGVTIVSTDVFVSVKVIFGKLDFVLVSISFLADSTSLASRTGVVVNVSCASCCGNFVKSGFPFFPFVGGRFCHLGSEGHSSRSDEPCQFWVDSFRLLVSFVLISSGMNPPLKPLVSLRIIFELIL